ncbi:MAG: hypothetical protein AAB544_01540 [Patescibacteria group bacterium]
MHILFDHKNETHRVFELKMLFLGLCVLLGMMLVIRFSSPSRRMNAEGIYSPAPMYGVQRYPRPITEFLRSSNAAAAARSSSESLSSEARSSVRERSSSSHQTVDRAQRRSERMRRERRTSVRTQSSARRDDRFAPGWFWR